MVQLAAVDRVVNYRGGVVLIGYNTALIPSKEPRSAIQWHGTMVENPENERNQQWRIDDKSNLFDIQPRFIRSSTW
jgi:hypothetical protein